jgi:hypothetical protein
LVSVPLAWNAVLEDVPFIYENILDHSAIDKRFFRSLWKP